MEKKILIIPTDGKRKPKVVDWSEALKFFKVDSDGLNSLIESGKEVKGFCVDEAVGKF